MPELKGLEIADPPERWEALGFAVDGESIVLGGVCIRLSVPGTGIVSWAIDPPASIGGLPMHDVAARATREVEHPNGARGIDHVVVITPDFGATSEELGRARMPLRRTIEARGTRMGFRRLGPAILELVEALDAPAPRFWGLVVNVADLHGLAGRLGTQLSEIRPAVQPGRHIATLQESAGLSTKLAFMDPELRSK